ncbi:MAG: VOC family protein [Rhizobiaceae bacterium]
MGLGITALAHVALKVADLERSLGFYRDTLGFTEMMRINYDDGRLMLVYLRMTDDQFIEIFPEGRDERAPDRNANAINHFCLQVDNMLDTVAALDTLGIRRTSGPNLGLDGNWQCWIEDPDGNRIEFMQMMPGCSQEVAVKRIRDTGK